MRGTMEGQICSESGLRMNKELTRIEGFAPVVKLELLEELWLEPESYLLSALRFERSLICFQGRLLSIEICANGISDFSSVSES